MPDPITATIGGSIGSGLLGASAASKAANAQTKAADQQVELAREQYNTTREDLSPFRSAGGLGLDAYMYELGLGSAPTIDGTAYAGYQESPDVTYAMKVGNDSVNALAGARGGLQSGATLKALQETAMGTAMQGRNAYLNRLAGLGDLGMNAAGMNAQNSQSYVNTSANALANIGNAQAAGAVGTANATAARPPSWIASTGSIPHRMTAPNMA